VYALEGDDSPTHPVAPWFAQFRSERRATRVQAATRRSRRTRALITIVHNEPVFLPIWLRYYSRFFAPEDIFVLDNDSAPGTLPEAGFVRIPASHDTVDHTWMVRTVERLQHELIERYDMVLVTDVDEIVAPHPRCGDLGGYLDDFGEEWVNCIGYELLHQPDREPAIDLSAPILAQRSCWFINGGYDKPALATTPMHWRPGFHGRQDFGMRFDPDLRLIHLHRMDYDLCLARHRARSAKRWAEADADAGWAVHNLLTEPEPFDAWFFGDSGFPGVPVTPEPISEAWRSVRV
jgi:hypothetical protein